MKIEFYKHNIGKEEKDKVLECLDGIFLTTGSYVAEFENKLAQYLNIEHVVGLTSCTAALHLSLLALNIGEGDEVITTPLTFIATATAIMHTGARPVFVDVEPETGLINPDNIKKAITKYTKAIIPVHLYGQMCDMKALKSIAQNSNLKIIEDAAHCLEGERDNIRPGQLGDIACFSFYATKNITSGEGGAIATKNEEIASRIRLLRQHGMTKEAADRYSGNYQHWDMIECGWKYNMDNIQASILLPQLDKIDFYWQKRDELFNYYLKQIQRVDGLQYPIIKNNSKSAYHLFTVWVNKKYRDMVLKKLNTYGIGVAVNYRAIHLLRFFKEKFGYTRNYFPHAEEIGDSTITLPFYLKLQNEEVDHVVKVLKEII